MREKSKMTNFTLIDPGNASFARLTNEFQEFRDYLIEIDQCDLDLCTIVLDECVNFISKNYQHYL